MDEYAQSVVHVPWQLLPDQVSAESTWWMQTCSIMLPVERGPHGDDVWTSNQCVGPFLKSPQRWSHGLASR